MVGTGVPEAPINKDGKPLAREDNVRSYTTVCRVHRIVDSEPPPPPMQRGAQSALWGCIAASVCPHGVRGCSTGRHWVEVRGGHCCNTLDRDALFHCAGNSEREKWWNGIANLFEAAPIGATEPEPVWKRLKTCSLANRQHSPSTVRQPQPHHVARGPGEVSHCERACWLIEVQITGPAAAGGTLVPLDVVVHAFREQSCSRRFPIKTCPE